MTSLLTLTNAAKLQGYLMATDAPRAIILLAEQMVEAATDGLSESTEPVQRISNGEVKVPELTHELAAAIVEAAKTAPTHDEMRFAAPETAQGEEELDSIDVDSGSEEHAPVTTGGGQCM
jgi:hypothetical protein